MNRFILICFLVRLFTILGLLLFQPEGRAAELFSNSYVPSEISVTVGKRTVAIPPHDGMVKGMGFPDMPIAVIGRRPFSFLMVCGNDTFLWSGRSLTDSMPVAKVLSPGPRGSVDNNYAGISSVYHDKKKKRLIAFYHAEDSEGIGKHEINGIPGFYGRVCVADSPDDKVQFTKLGPIITADQPKKPRGWETEGGPVAAWLAQGVGDPSVCIDATGDNLLCMYMELSNRLKPGRGVQLHVARAPIESAGMPGSWSKFHKGSYSEPGISGHETAVISAFPLGEAISPHLQYVPQCKRYVATFAVGLFGDINGIPPKVTESGVYISTSKDGTIWTKPTKVEGIFSIFINGQECMMHPFLTVSSASDSRISGQLMYRYTPRWPEQGYLTAMPIQISINKEVTVTSVVPREPPTPLEKPSAFVFRGNSSIETPLKRFTPVTIEAWVKPEQNEKDVFVIGSSSATHQGIGLGLNNGVLRAQYLIGDIGSPARVPTTEWSHVAAVYDTDATYLYLNGKQVGKGPANKTANDNPLFVIGDIGKDYSGHHFQGQIRSVRISNGVRYTGDFVPTPTFTKDLPEQKVRAVLIYDGSLTRPSEATDLSGNENHGRLDGVTNEVIVSSREPSEAAKPSDANDDLGK